MRIVLPVLVYCAVTFGVAASAQTASDSIRSLYDGVSHDRIQASPQADIISHIQEMGQRKEMKDSAFAVPEIDMEILLQDRGQEDALMDPRVLEAIARMPRDRAAQVLRLIEERRSGLKPLQDIPPLSLDDGDPVPDSLALKGWVLERDASGAPYIQLGSDAASRILIVPSMVLGDLGRVTAVQDDTDGFRVTLETGDTLEGEVMTAQPLNTEPSSEDTAALSGVTEVIAVSRAGKDIIRPRARPEGLLIAREMPDAKAADLPPDEEVAVSATIRPKRRPADLSGETP
jgi:hypothetical protein